MPSDDRRYPKRPVLGVGALIFREDRILLVRRGKEPLSGLWSLPGGALETGELMKDGIRREVLEETGFVIEPVKISTIFERLIPDDSGRTEYHFVLIDYLCEIVGGEGKASSDVSALAWVKESELRNYKITHGTVPVIQDEFRKRRQSMK